MGMKENMVIAKRGGNVAKTARTQLEEELRESVIASDNSLNYQNIDDKVIETKVKK